MTESGPSALSRASGTSSVRSGELFAALSLATDLGTGQAAEHGLRTCLLALELADLAGLDAQQVEDAYHLGLLHSIGLLARITGFADLARTAASDHERLDGSGYHRGLDATQLSAAARVLAAADMWCARTGGARPK